MKILKVYEQHSDIDVLDVMKRSVEYYKYIDVMGEKLSEIISAQVQPLLDGGNFEEARQMVRDFYKPARYKSGETETEGDVIFIEYDMLMSKINRYKNDIKKFNL